MRCSVVAGGRSIQWSTSSIGTTSVCPVCRGLMERKATQWSSRQTNRPGSSPSMMRVKIVVMVCPPTGSGRGLGPDHAPARAGS